MFDCGSVTCKNCRVLQVLHLLFSIYSVAACRCCFAPGSSERILQSHARLYPTLRNKTPSHPITSHPPKKDNGRKWSTMNVHSLNSSATYAIDIFACKNILHGSTGPATTELRRHCGPFSAAIIRAQTRSCHGRAGRAVNMPIHMVVSTCFNPQRMKEQLKPPKKSEFCWPMSTDCPRTTGSAVTKRGTWAGRTATRRPICVKS